MAGVAEAEMARRLTATEVDALNASLTRRLAARVPLDAQAPEPPAAAPKPPTPEAVFGSSAMVSVGTGLSVEQLAGAASLRDVVTGVDTAISIALDGENALKTQIARLEIENASLTTEIARLRAQFAEARAEFAEAKHTLERLQITREGRRGERGSPGADGPRGERGEPGPKGVDAPRITAWSVNSDDFTAVPILSNGEPSATLRLRPLFEEFAEQISMSDEAAEAAASADAARARRIEVELEVTRQRLGLPR